MLDANLFSRCRKVCLLYFQMSKGIRSSKISFLRLMRTTTTFIVADVNGISLCYSLSNNILVKQEKGCLYKYTDVFLFAIIILPWLACIKIFYFPWFFYFEARALKILWIYRISILLQDYSGRLLL
jgi:hypothetical protein